MSVGRNLIIRSEREGKGSEVGEEDLQKILLGLSTARLYNRIKNKTMQCTCNAIYYDKADENWGWELRMKSREMVVLDPGVKVEKWQKNSIVWIILDSSV